MSRDRVVGIGGGDGDISFVPDVLDFLLDIANSWDLAIKSGVCSRSEMPPGEASCFVWWMPLKTARIRIN